MIKSLITKVKRIPKKQMYIAGTVVLVLAVSTFAYIQSKTEKGIAIEKSPMVKSVNIVDLSLTGKNIEYGVTASGKVRASKEADLVTETSGVVRSVNVSIGDNVYAGQTLIVLSNSDAIAQVAQAEAQLSAAESAAASTNTNQDNSLVALIDATENAIAKINEVKETKIAIFFTDPEDLSEFGTNISQGDKTYYVGATDYQKRDIINNKAADLEAQIVIINQQRNNINPSNVVNISVKSEKALLTMRELLDLMGNEVNSYISKNSTDKAVYESFQSTISIAKTSVNSGLTTVRTAKQGYNSASKADTSSSIAQAKANLSLAQAQLNKTVLRAPFSGSILSVAPQPGEFISMGSKAISIIGSSGKEVIASLSGSEASKVSTGSQVLIDEKYTGTVTKKAPGINTQTGKVDVIISVNSGQSILLGEFVNVKIQSNNSSGTAGVFVPLKAVKVTTSGSVVYVVDDENIAHEISVMTGEIVGESIEIVSGLSGNERIVSIARGMLDGMYVLILE